MIFTGILKQKRRNPGLWKVGEELFTIDVKQNQWIVRELKKFKNTKRVVIVWINEERRLLSVKAKYEQQETRLRYRRNSNSKR